MEAKGGDTEMKVAGEGGTGGSFICTSPVWQKAVIGSGGGVPLVVRQVSGRL